MLLAQVQPWAHTWYVTVEENEWYPVMSKDYAYSPGTIKIIDNYGHNRSYIRRNFRLIILKTLKHGVSWSTLSQRLGCRELLRHGAVGN